MLKELAEEDAEAYHNYHRVDEETFNELLNLIHDRIKKRTTNMREPIDPGMRLAITLRYLASGDSYHSLEFNFRVPHNTISGIVTETCQALYEELNREFLPCPTSEDKWLDVARGFARRWQFHNCVGALDGKHVRIKAPNKSGTVFYNYKGYFSLVLFGLVDADYNFLYIDVGRQGSASDGGIFKSCSLRRRFDEGTLGLPQPTPLPGDDFPLPFYIIGDDAFPLKEWLMKPFPHRGLSKSERVYNYRLSRARRVVENAFGVLAHRFRCLLTTMHQTPDHVEIIVMACCVLHNYIRKRNPRSFYALLDTEDIITHKVIPGKWRTTGALDSIEKMLTTNLMKRAKNQREYLREYYSGNCGRLEWQDDMI